jgi:putative transposase
MSQKRYRPEEIIAKLREAEVLLGQGQTVPEDVKVLGISEVSYYRWRQEYGGLSVSQAKRLKDLERENARLRRADHGWRPLTLRVETPGRRPGKRPGCHDA